MPVRPTHLVAAVILAIAGPALARPLGSCEISVADPVSLPCNEGACRCIPVANACPFPVNAVYETGGGQRTVRIEAGITSQEACATQRDPDAVRFLAWRPAVGYPLPGHPVPMDGVSMTGPVSEIP